MKKVLIKPKHHHNWTYNIIIDDGKPYGKYIVIRKGTLIEECEECEMENVYFCLGGLVFREST
jgi:hypothetical protein